MEDLLKLVTEHCNAFTTTIEIDNSTNAKDFVARIRFKDGQGDKDGLVTLNLDDENRPTLNINGFTLFGREAKLFKEFINQIPS